MTQWFIARQVLIRMRDIVGTAKNQHLRSKVLSKAPVLVRVHPHHQYHSGWGTVISWPWIRMHTCQASDDCQHCR